MIERGEHPFIQRWFVAIGIEPLLLERKLNEGMGAVPHYFDAFYTDDLPRIRWLCPEAMAGGSAVENTKR